ncbi:hypothetical protein K469DRAFT_651793 [Zopfia rhizophila CBS 207.26]|uniref:Amino acid permease/ SLC12A domain-containing protein n=1 Tax=Zopfia rhizophila CBS 207.26 TaxID=1314779 RepID=A0A6A6EQG9_9PEZI|nr:hypothetical protein K469DRAFT_651793 [Zopfia rhizophila CBS 207.26]
MSNIQQNHIPLQAIRQPQDNSSKNVGSENASAENESVIALHRIPFASNFAKSIFRYQSLDRSLERSHLTGIAFTGMVGIGLFITSGQVISLSGSAGCVISYFLAGLIVIAVMRSMAEMVSVRPFSGALIDFCDVFVDPALGFAVGITYLLAQCISMACLTSAAARVADNFHGRGKPLDPAGKAAVIVGLLVLTLASNILGIKIYGLIERCIKWFKILLFVTLIVLMIAVQLGVGGSRTGLGSNNHKDNPLPPGFKPAGYNQIYPLSYSSNDPMILEIPGVKGRFLAFWTTTTWAMFACLGGEMVIVTAGEAKRPRRDLAPATRFMYLLPIFFYILTAFVMGFNINYANEDLFRAFSADNKLTPHSPFYIIIRATSISVLPTVLNACFLVSAYTAGNTSLYTASRTLFELAQRYGNEFLQATVGATNPGHTPIAAVLCCATFGLLAFLGLADQTFDQPILSLAGFYTSTLACVYAAECVAFLRFRSGLNRLSNEGAYSRDDPPYTDRYYRAHWQPLCAIFGFCGCVMIVLFSGWPAIYIISQRSSSDDGLKSNGLLAADLVGAYSGPILFLTLYAGYKMLYRKPIRSLRELNIGVYEPPQFPFDRDDNRVRLETWTDWAKEIWSFIR